MHTRTTVETGLEILLATGLSHLNGLRAGLITNHTGVDHTLRSSVDLLRESPYVKVCALFGPEHGIYGNVQAGVKVEHMRDERSDLPMYSLYGAHRRPTAEMLQGLDALIFDIQDLGARYSTYIGTMLYAMEAVAEAGLLFIVCDRPNPLGGNVREGNILDPAFVSFVGCHRIPIRHGLTSGELARLIAAERGWPEPVVITMRGWRRELWYDETDLPWVQPTPNLPTLESHTLYPGTCLFEGTSLTEGRGTTRPFELIGAPGLEPFQLARVLNSLELPGVGFRPHYFTPAFSKHAGSLCGGVQVHILQRSLLRPVETGLTMVHTLRKLVPEQVVWIENRPGYYFIDLLFGSDQPRLMLEQGASVAEIMHEWVVDMQEFEERSRPYLLY